MIEARLGYDPEAAQAMYEAYKDAPGTKRISFEEFNACYGSHGLFFGIYDPQPVGAVTYDGPFIHAAVLPRVRAKWGPVFIACLRYGLARVPFVISRVHPAHSLMKRMIVALGFKRAPFDDPDGCEFYVRHAHGI